jgi:hypothetical protein
LSLVLWNGFLLTCGLPIVFRTSLLALLGWILGLRALRRVAMLSGLETAEEKEGLPAETPPSSSSISSRCVSAKDEVNDRRGSKLGATAEAPFREAKLSLNGPAPAPDPGEVESELMRMAGG